MTNQRPVFRSHCLYWPIRGQYSLYHFQERHGHNPHFLADPVHQGAGADPGETEDGGPPLPHAAFPGRKVRMEKKKCWISQELKIWQSPSVPSLVYLERSITILAQLFSCSLCALLNSHSYFIGQTEPTLSCFNVLTFNSTLKFFRALSSGSGFIKLNGYHSESNVAKDGVELNSTHMNLSSACCSANRDLKEMFCHCFHWILSKMQPSYWLSPSSMCMCKERLWLCTVWRP